MPEILVTNDAGELAEQARTLASTIIATAIDQRGVANIALSGGSTPGETYRLLAESGLDIEHCRWFFVDERCVAPDNERSNYRAARRELFESAKISDAHVFRMLGELGAEAGARAYTEVLDAELGAGAPMDLVIAGLGNDGHTASLFPGTGAVRLPGRVVAVTPGGELEPRISLGRDMLLASRRVLLLVSGAGKRSALVQALATGDEDVIPARIYLAAPAGVVTVIMDAAAQG